MALLSVDLSGRSEAAWLAPHKENRGEQAVISRNPAPREKVLCSLKVLSKGHQPGVSSKLHPYTAEAAWL